MNACEDGSELTDLMPHALPEDCFWVCPGRLLAGPTPDRDGYDTRDDRLMDLLGLGIRGFIDLRRSREGATYKHVVLELVEGLNIQYCRMGIENGSAPSVPVMRATLDTIDLWLSDGRPTFVHCVGGCGRSGTVAGCWLARHGIAVGEGVLVELEHLRAALPAPRPCPETDEQRDLVRAWRIGQ
jgi:hypothetical protein